MIEIKIPEAVIPYVRMTQRSKFVDKRAIAYLSNQQTLKWYFRQAMEAHAYEMYDKKPMAVELVFYVVKKRLGDLDNLCKAMIDAAQGIVYANDVWIDYIVVTRALSSEPSVTMRVRELVTRT